MNSTLRTHRRTALSTLRENGGVVKQLVLTTLLNEEIIYCEFIVKCKSTPLITTPKKRGEKQEENSGTSALEQCSKHSQKGQHTLSRVVTPNLALHSWQGPDIKIFSNLIFAGNLNDPPSCHSRRLLSLHSCRRLGLLLSFRLLTSLKRSLTTGGGITRHPRGYWIFRPAVDPMMVRFAAAYALIIPFPLLLESFRDSFQHFLSVLRSIGVGRFGGFA